MLDELISECIASPASEEAGDAAVPIGKTEQRTEHYGTGAGILLAQRDMLHIQGTSLHTLVPQ